MRYGLDRCPACAHVFPYKSRLKWWLRPRQQHLVDTLEDRPESFKGADGKILKRRVRSIGVWLRVRVVLIVLLSFSIIASITTIILNALGGPQEATTAVQIINRIASASAGLLSALYFFTLRTLGQLEMDALLLLPAHRK